MSNPVAPRYVTFRLGRELFAIAVGSVERVLRYTEPRRVPHAPAGIAGILDLDAVVMPVVDLRERLGAEVTAPAPQTRLLVLSVDGELAALIVDQVLDVRAYEGSAVAETP